MRGRLVILLLCCLPVAAAAQEPLFLRIRPNAPDAAAAGSDPDLEAARARAAREAVWQRADRRARIAIASVCTGCLKPEGPVSSPPPESPTPPRPDSPAAREASAHEPLPPADTR